MDVSYLTFCEKNKYAEKKAAQHRWQLGDQSLRNRPRITEHQHQVQGRGPPRGSSDGKETDMSESLTPTQKKVPLVPIPAPE